MITSIKASYSESAEVEFFREMNDLDFDELSKSEEGFFCLLFNEENNEVCVLGGAFENPFPVQSKENSEEKEQPIAGLRFKVSDGEKEREVLLTKATDEDLFIISAVFKALSCSRFLPLREVTVRKVDSFPKVLNEYKTKKFFIVQDASCSKATQSYKTTNCREGTHNAKRRRNIQKRIKSFAGMNDFDSKTVSISSKPMVLVSDSELSFDLD